MLKFEFNFLLYKVKNLRTVILVVRYQIPNKIGRHLVINTETVFILRIWSQKIKSRRFLLRNSNFFFP